jgi:hypothetical protein
MTKMHGVNSVESIMKIMSKTLNGYLGRLQQKLKLTDKETHLHIRKFLLHFSMVQCTSHQPITVADLGLRVNHLKPVISSYLQNLFFF